jgi:phosphoglycolate phosphatase
MPNFDEEGRIVPFNRRGRHAVAAQMSSTSSWMREFRNGKPPILNGDEGLWLAISLRGAVQCPALKPLRTLGSGCSRPRLTLGTTRREVRGALPHPGGASVRNCIIFDLDGTLVDSNAVCVGILQAMLEERGSDRRIDLGESARHMSLGGERMVSALLGQECGNPAAELAEFRDRYARTLTPHHSLFEGVRSGLEHLRSVGLELAICSNKPISLCTKVLEDTGLAPLFGVIVGGQVGMRPKPAPDLLDATLLQLCVPADQCIFVGDSELDHDAASDAAIPFCFMRYGYAKPGWEPDHGESFDSFSSLVEHLLARVCPDAG